MQLPIRNAHLRLKSITYAWHKPCRNLWVSINMIQKSMIQKVKTGARYVGGAACLAAGAVGVLVPVIPGIPLLLIGGAMVGLPDSTLDRVRLASWRAAGWTLEKVGGRRRY